MKTRASLSFLFLFYRDLVNQKIAKVRVKGSVRPRHQNYLVGVGDPRI